MSQKIAILYGSLRRDRAGICVVRFLMPYYARALKAERFRGVLY